MSTEKRLVIDLTQDDDDSKSNSSNSSSSSSSEIIDLTGDDTETSRNKETLLGKTTIITIKQFSTILKRINGVKKSEKSSRMSPRELKSLDIAEKIVGKRKRIVPERFEFIDNEVYEKQPIDEKTESTILPTLRCRRTIEPEEWLELQNDPLPFPMPTTIPVQIFPIQNEEVSCAQVLSSLAVNEPYFVYV